MVILKKQYLSGQCLSEWGGWSATETWKRETCKANVPIQELLRGEVNHTQWHTSLICVAGIYLTEKLSQTLNIHII